MKGIIMAGGEGQRLRPLTIRRPKPLIDMLGRPVMEYIIDVLTGAGICDIGVTLMYLGEKIEEYFGSGKDFSANLDYFWEKHPLGTAGSVKNAGDFLDDDFLVVSGDCVCDFDLKTAIDFHKKNDADATIILKKEREPLDFGVVLCDAKNRIERFIEKPRWGEVLSDKINTGIYIFKKSILDLIPENRPCDFSKDLFPKMLGEGMRMFGFEPDGYWCDVGTLAALMRCNIDILSSRVGGAKLTGVRDDGMKRARQHGLNMPSFLDEGAYCAENAGPYVVCGKNSSVLSPEVSYSIFGSHVNVMRGSCVSGAIVADNCHIEPSCDIREASVIGPGCVVEQGSIISAGTKIWPDKKVLRGSFVASPMGRPVDVGASTVSYEDENMGPDIAALLGSAVGSLKKKPVVFVGDDGRGRSKMLKCALIGGLMSTGAAVVNCAKCYEGSLKYAVKSRDGDYGVYVKSDGEFSGCLVFDCRGLFIDSSDERKMRRVMAEGSFYEAASGEIAQVGEIRDADEKYIKTAISSFKKAKRGTAVCVKGVNAKAFMLRRVLKGLKYELVSTTDADEKKALLIDMRGEPLFYDKGGREIDETRCIEAFARAFAENFEGEDLSIPIWAPKALDERVKISDAGLLRYTSDSASTGPRAEFSRAMFEDPVLYSVCVISALTSRRQESVCEPTFFLKREASGCELNKSSVISSLRREKNCVKSEEGIKIEGDSFRVLIIPHDKKSLYKIYVESKSMEMSKELCDYYEKCINESKN